MNELARKMIQGMTEKNSEIEFKIKANTELFRKGFGKLVLMNADGRTPYKGKAEITLKQKTHEYHFGANLFMLGGFPDREKNEAFEDAFKSLFNLGVIPFPRLDVEPGSGQMCFPVDSPEICRCPPTDACVDYCARNSLVMKGDPLCWNQWLPNDRKAFVRLLEKNIAKIAEHYAEKIFIFDMVNKAIPAACPDTLDRSRIKPSPYPGQTDMIEIAFGIAGKYFPGAQLVLNDDNHCWMNQGQYSHFLLLAKHLISSGHRPGGLGFQYHFSQKYFEEPEKFRYFMNAENLYRMLDLYGELDIPCSLTGISIMGRKNMLGNDADEVQKIFTERLYRLWFSHPATDGIIWWNPVDGTAAAGGKPGSDQSENSSRAGLFRYDMSLKPAGEAVRRLTQEEWRTRDVIRYEEGGDNRFRGFYGQYDALIRTDSGKFKTEFALSRFAPAQIHLPLRHPEENA